MMKKILVTGCNGQLGRAIRQEYKGEDVSFINTDVAEGEGIVALDITDVNAVLALVRAERPEDKLFSLRLRLSIGTDRMDLIKFRIWLCSVSLKYIIGGNVDHFCSNFSCCDT